MPYESLLPCHRCLKCHLLSSWLLLSHHCPHSSMGMSNRLLLPNFQPDITCSVSCWSILPRHRPDNSHPVPSRLLLPKDQPHSASPLPSWYLFLQYQHHSLHILCSRHVLRRCGRLLSMHCLLSTGTAELCQRPDYPGVHYHVRCQVCPLYKQDCQRQPHSCVRLDLPFGLLLQEQLRSLPGLQDKPDLLHWQLHSGL